MSPVRLASTAIEFIFQANPGLAKGRVTEKSSVLVWMHCKGNSGCCKKRSAEYTAKSIKF